MKKYMVNVSESCTWYAVVEAESREKATELAQRVLDEIGHAAFDGGFESGYEIDDVSALTESQAGAAVTFDESILCDCGYCDIEFRHCPACSPHVTGTIRTDCSACKGKGTVIR